MKRIYFSLIFLIGMNAKALTFDQAFQTSAENSHELKELRLESESASWSKAKAMAGFMPRVELDGRHLFSERFQELEIVFGGQNFVMPAIQPYSSLGVTASFNLFNGFQSTREFQAAVLEKTKADYRLKRAEEQKRVEIRSLFYKALGSQVLITVADQNIQTLEGHLNDLNSRVRSGVSTRYDLLRVEVQYEEAKTEKVSAESYAAIARANLFEAIGIADDGKALEGKLPDDFSQIKVNEIKLQPELRNDRSALIAERDQLQKKASASHAHWMPQVNAFGTYEWYNNINHSITDSDQRFKSDYAVGLQFNWSLFDGGAKYASEKQAALAVKIADEKLAKLDQVMIGDLEEAKRRFSYDVINFNAKLSSIKKSEEAVRLARGGLRAGTRTNTEVLDAVVDLNRAKAAAVKSQVDAIEAWGLLELSQGQTQQ